MSYKKHKLHGIAYRQTPPKHNALSSTVHAKFQADFDKGYDEAMTKAQELAKEGWILQSPITLMQNRAKEKLANLTREGFDAVFVPAAEWQGEKMGVILFREKPKSKTAAPTPKPATTSPSSSAPSTLAQADAEAKFAKIFPGATKDPNAGAWMEPGRAMALVAPELSGGLGNMAKQHAMDPSIYTIDSAKLSNATKEYVIVGNKTVAVKLLKAGIKILGDNPEAIEGDPNSPLFLRKNDVTVIIAPAEVDQDQQEPYGGL